MAKPALQKGSSTLQEPIVTVTADIPEVPPDPDPPGADLTIQHFVTPKGDAQDVVTLTVSISQDEAYLKQFIEWEVVCYFGWTPMAVSHGVPKGGRRGGRRRLQR